MALNDPGTRAHDLCTPRDSNEVAPKEVVMGLGALLDLAQVTASAAYVESAESGDRWHVTWVSERAIAHATARIGAGPRWNREVTELSVRLWSMQDVVTVEIHDMQTASPEGVWYGYPSYRIRLRDRNELLLPPPGDLLPRANNEEADGVVSAVRTHLSTR